MLLKLNLTPVIHNVVNRKYSVSLFIDMSRNKTKLLPEWEIKPNKSWDEVVFNKSGLTLAPGEPGKPGAPAGPRGPCRREENQSTLGCVWIISYFEQHS